MSDFSVATDNAICSLGIMSYWFHTSIFLKIACACTCTLKLGNTTCLPVRESVDCIGGSLSMEMKLRRYLSKQRQPHLKGPWLHRQLKQTGHHPISSTNLDSTQSYSLVPVWPVFPQKSVCQKMPRNMPAIKFNSLFNLVWLDYRFIMVPTQHGHDKDDVSSINYLRP